MTTYITSAKSMGRHSGQDHNEECDHQLGDAEEADPERDGRDMGAVETIFAPEGPDIFVDSNHDS